MFNFSFSRYLESIRHFFEFQLQIVVQSSVPCLSVRMFFRVHFRILQSEFDSEFSLVFNIQSVIRLSIVQFRIQWSALFRIAISTIIINSIAVKTQKNFDYNLVLKYVKISLLNYAQRFGYE